ncbi:hypothetical protein R5W24_000337 [Gemmata sp. JC717]|nr:hypothetical protein [Gemmata algarum]MDY3551262.1 hypothetical protein [Gemmata algarum]
MTHVAAATRASFHFAIIVFVTSSVSDSTEAGTAPDETPSAVTAWHTVA